MNLSPLTVQSLSPRFGWLPKPTKETKETKKANRGDLGDGRCGSVLRLAGDRSSVIDRFCGSPALESELPRADAVVCLFTADDEGCRKGEADLRPHSRQNVLIESGHAVISKRRRSVIIALGDVEVPSDFGGFLVVQQGTWDANSALALGRHLKAMGLTVDPLSATP